MSQWPMKPLEEVCAINPRLPRNHGLADDAAVSFVPMAAVDERAGVISAHQRRPYSEVKKGYTHFVDGDVLFAKITPCMENGKAAIARGLVGGNGFGSTEFHTLRGNGAVLPEWLFYFIRREAFRAEAKRNFTGTAGQQRVPAAFLARSLIPMPPLPEQRRIVDLLARAEGIVRLRREAEKKAAELIPALFLDMFGDPATNMKGWDSGKFEDFVGDIRNGLNPSKDQFGSGTRFITVNDLYDGITITGKKADRVMIDQHTRDKYRLYSGDLCFVRSSVKRAGVGMASVYASNDEAVFGGFVIRARLNQLLLPMFACAMFHTPSMRKMIVESAGTGTITNINQPALLGLPVIAPPIDLQLRFVQRLEEGASIQSQQAAATAKAQETFDALLGQVFSQTAGETL